MAESIASRNIFDLLQDDAPDAEVSFNIKPVAEKKAKAPAKAAAQPEKSKAPVANQRAKNTQGRSGNRDGAPREYRPRDGAARENRPRDQSNREFTPRDNNREFTGRSRQNNDSRDRTRGRGREGGAPSGNRRTYDRHSATGIEDSEKKSKMGWMGDDSKVIKDQEVAASEAHADAAEAAEAQPEAIPEPEDNTKTLDQYLKEKLEKAAIADAEQKQIRKANEGVDASLLKSNAVLAKEEELFYSGKSSASKAKKQSKTQREKTQLEFQARFAPTERQKRNQREDRDRNFGRNRRTHNNLNVNDESAFPSLG
ncbi:hypothetical protein AYI70_g8078 [Smittium culicis]|uniref:Hyaluronan/mRNA-binding protein domain-containing protein n=1 Tax=Smittium culicis TaxID=133412 RepID=A0A1R1XHK2_9FUNG|nr:hypothetical protein AYI70_g8078 [Smittium culicis]